jgi:hypothetical protein
MSDQSSEDPRWLDEFEDLANRRLEEGSSCDQVHPIVERWFHNLMEGEPPPSRPSIMQAMACLSTEVLYNSPEDLTEILRQHIEEDDLALWIEHILLVGRAFEIALRKGDLDDL